MSFTPYKNSLPLYDLLDIKIGGQNVHATDRIKYLRVTIDLHLRWDIHVHNVKNTLSYVRS